MQLTSLCRTDDFSITVYQLAAQEGGPLEAMGLRTGIDLEALFAVRKQVEEALPEAIRLCSGSRAAPGLSARQLNLGSVFRLWRRAMQVTSLCRTDDFSTTVYQLAAQEGGPHLAV